MEFLGGEEEGGVMGGIRGGREEEEEEEEEEREGYDGPVANNNSAALEHGNEQIDTAVPTDNSVGFTNVPSLSNRLRTRSPSLNQQRYSLLVEKIPTQLRSNTALFNYFNEIFPGQVHSACIAMNVPDLDNLSARRLRVTRRLEKSLAYYNVTGIRPTHIAGRPRFFCCGIESTPVDALCLACCCCHDSCGVDRACIGGHDSIGDNDGNTFPDFYDDLPGKGEMVDSISYYIKDLAQCNLKMQELQKEKLGIAKGEGDTQRMGAGMEWYTDTLVWAKQNAKMAAEGLREEFEVLLDEEEPDPREGTVGYGSFQTDERKKSESPLVKEDHLLTGCLPCDYGDSDPTPTCRNCVRSRRHSKAYKWLRAMLWRGGVSEEQYGRCR